MESTLVNNSGYPIPFFLLLYSGALFDVRKYTEKTGTQVLFADAPANYC